MYNDDKELYEINIDKLCYSLENSNDIMVNEYIQSTEGKIKREDWDKKKNDVKKALSDLYDVIYKKSFEAVKKHMKRFDKGISEAKIKKAVSFVDKTKFINGLMKTIESESKVTAENESCKVLTIDRRVLNEIFKDAEETYTSTDGYEFGDDIKFKSSKSTIETVNYEVEAVINTFKDRGLIGLFGEKKYKNSFFKVKWAYVNQRYHELAIVPKFKIK